MADSFEIPKECTACTHLVRYTDSPRFKHSVFYCNTFKKWEGEILAEKNCLFHIELYFNIEVKWKHRSQSLMDKTFLHTVILKKNASIKIYVRSYSAPSSRTWENISCNKYEKKIVPACNFMKENTFLLFIAFQNI